jgi:hypothetical protein
MTETPYKEYNIPKVELKEFPPEQMEPLVPFSPDIIIKPVNDLVKDISIDLGKSLIPKPPTGFLKKEGKSIKDTILNLKKEFDDFKVEYQDELGIIKSSISEANKLVGHYNRLKLLANQVGLTKEKVMATLPDPSNIKNELKSSIESRLEDFDNSSNIDELKLWLSQLKDGYNITQLIEVSKENITSLLVTINLANNPIKFNSLNELNAILDHLKLNLLDYNYYLIDHYQSITDYLLSIDEVTLSNKFNSIENHLKSIKLCDELNSLTLVNPIDYQFIKSKLIELLQLNSLAEIFNDLNELLDKCINNELNLAKLNDSISEVQLNTSDKNSVIDKLPEELKVGSLSEEIVTKFDELTSSNDVRSQVDSEVDLTKALKLANKLLSGVKDDEYVSGITDRILDGVEDSIKEEVNKLVKKMKPKAEKLIGKLKIQSDKSLEVKALMIKMAPYLAMPKLPGASLNIFK